MNEEMKKLSVLIVDDNPVIGDTLTDILEEIGYNVMFTTSGEDALSIIKEKSCDAILLDIKMPGMNGIETFRRIKRRPPCRRSRSS